LAPAAGFVSSNPNCQISGNLFPASFNNLDLLFAGQETNKHQKAAEEKSGQKSPR
jgi:hypothetical protein